MTTPRLASFPQLATALLPLMMCGGSSSTSPTTTTTTTTTTTEATGTLASAYSKFGNGILIEYPQIGIMR